ncbi:hypothetical protein HDV00_011093 [Rhizophlyctis rosea]|nr:hypothetical protein HDV00_011093 [Rhizophlyctis rosea]
MFSSRDIFDPPTRLERIFSSPLQFVVTTLYHFFNAFRVPRSLPTNTLRIVCISDTHTLQWPIPDGDLIIHAGDLTNKGTVSELQAQIDWLSSLPHAHKVVISGNHDTYLDHHSRVTLTEAEQAERLDWKDVKYLQDSSVRLEFANGRKLNIYGAPQIPKCGGSSFAFQYHREMDVWAVSVAWMQVLVERNLEA